MKNSDATAKSCFELSDKIGWPHGLTEWRVMLDSGVLLSKADDKGNLIATGLLTSHKNGQSLGMVLVDPDHRRQGHGMEIVIHAINLSQSFNQKVIRLVSSPEAEPLYYKLGFITIGFINVFSKDMRASSHAGIAVNKNQIIAEIDAELLSKQYYYGCEQYTHIIRNIVDSSGYSFVQYDRNNRISAFCSSFDRVSKNCGHVLALGPVIASDVVAFDNMLDDIEITCCDCDEVTCFVYSDLFGAKPSEQNFRTEISDLLIRRGFVLEDKLAFMVNDISTTCNFIPQGNVISPVSLALG